MPNPYTGNNIPDQVQGFLSLIPGTRQNRDWRTRSDMERQALIEQAKQANNAATQQNQVFELARTNPALNQSLTEALGKHLGLGLTQAQTGHANALTGYTGAQTAGQLQQNTFAPREFESKMSNEAAARTHLGQQGAETAERTRLMEPQFKEEQRRTDVMQQGNELTSLAHLFGYIPQQTLAEGPPDKKGKTTMVPQQNPMVGQILQRFGVSAPQTQTNSPMNEAVMQMLHQYGAQQQSPGAGRGGATPAVAQTTNPAGAVSSAPGMTATDYLKKYVYNPDQGVMEQMGERSGAYGDMMQTMKAPAMDTLQKILQYLQSIQDQLPTVGTPLGTFNEK